MPMPLRRFAERAVDLLAIATFSGCSPACSRRCSSAISSDSPLTWSDELGALPVRLVRVPGLGDRGAAAQPPRDQRGADARCRARLRAALALFAALAALAFAVILSYYGVRITLRNADVETTSLFFTMGVVYAIVPVAALAVALHAIGDVVGARRASSRARRRRRDDHADAGDPGGVVRRAVRRTGDLRGDGTGRIRLPAAGRHARHRHSAEDGDGGQLVSAARRAAVHPDGQPDELGGHLRPDLRLRQGGRRLDARRSRAGQHHRLADLRRHERLGGRRRGRDGRGRDRGDEEGGLRRRDRGRGHRRVGDHRADHPAVAADDRLRRRRRNLDRRAVHRRHHPRPADGRRR